MRKIVLLTFSLFSLAAQADESYLKPYLGNSPVQIGSAEYYKLIIDVYTAKLFANNEPFDANKPYALELDYKINANGSNISEISLEMMQDIEKFDEATAAKYLKIMYSTFPDIKKGDSITGVNLPNKGAVFFKNGQNIGIINDPQFAQRFFAIWISPKTSDKKFRKKLLNID